MRAGLTRSPFNFIVILAALGYFVDIYDLVLFSIVRIPSLEGLGVPSSESLDVGIALLNTQMIGMLLGGILWGVLGDKAGRLSVLCLTIFTYSVANIANGFVQSVEQYHIARFIAGIGLAGELGIGITLVAEAMTQETRGYGTSIVSAIGVAGAVLAFIVNDFFDWRVTYIVGGILGLLLLLLRASAYESGMFAKTKEHPVPRGAFLSLFTNRRRFLKYVYCILIGLPVWYVIGILVTFSPEFASKVFHVTGKIDAGMGVMIHYTGVSIGSFTNGVISQLLRSRKKALYIAMSGLTLVIAAYYSAFGVSPPVFYTILFFLGVTQGYWSVFITIAAEQFGTNIRATVTTTVPNFVRGGVVPMAYCFNLISDSHGLWIGGVSVAIVVMALAFFALYHVEETFHKDLDFHELI